MKLVLLTILLLISFPTYAGKLHSGFCEEISVSLSPLKKGQTVRLKQGELYIYIYKRTDSEVEYSLNRTKTEYDSKYPTWWSQYKYPTRYFESSERSISPDIFVFWDASPMYSYPVAFISPQWSLEGVDLSYLGEEWSTGFIDYYNEIYYDITGRPTKWGEKSKGQTYSFIPLLTPNHSYDKQTDTVTILCNKT